MLSALSLVFVALAVVSDAATGPVTSRSLTETSVIDVARKRLPTIVFVRSDDSASPAGPRGGSGSGVIVDASGLIVTNAHVVGNAPGVHVLTADGDELDAKVIGIDSIADLALLRIKAPRSLRVAPLGDSDRLEPGQWVIALGNPVELHHSVTVGIVSAVARTVGDDGQEFIQTDASINPGSSGGALFDLRGNLVGITTGMLSAVGEDAGLNFAIPVDVLKDLLPQLKHGVIEHGWIGASLTPIARPETGGYHGTPGPTTLRVTAVALDGPAERAGITPGDIIAGIAGAPPARARDVLRRLRLTKPGTPLSLRVERDGVTIQIPVVMAANPHQGNWR
jgi:serine protease Do